jgi:hypothetical protein
MLTEFTVVLTATIIRPTIYLNKRQYNPEDSKLHTRRRENLKSQNQHFFFTEQKKSMKCICRCRDVFWRLSNGYTLEQWSPLAVAVTDNLEKPKMYSWHCVNEPA